MSKVINEAVNQIPIDENGNIKALALADCYRNMIFSCQDKVGPHPRTSIVTEISIEQEPTWNIGQEKSARRENLIMRMTTYTEAPTPKDGE